MAAKSKIAWTDATFNPWWGCQRVSPGCGMGKSVGGCYAEAFAKRTGHDVWGPTAPRRFFGEKHWREPTLWNAEAERDGTRRRVFCASMADVFEDRRDLDPWREKLWMLIEKTPHLDWLLLTKRPENMLRMAPERWRELWPRNVWAGTTAENQHYYDLRWPHLAPVPAAVHFISHEPAIGPLVLKCNGCGHDVAAHFAPDGGGCEGWFPNWCITGGESGGGPREYQIAWARSLIEQTRGTRIRCFVKQLGANAISEDGGYRVRLRLVDRAGANPEEWPSDLRSAREWPEVRHAS